MLVEKIIEQLRDHPATRTELTVSVGGASKRGVHGRLQMLIARGFITRSNRKPYVYTLVTEVGLFIPCPACRRVRPCWVLTGGVCNYCRNLKGAWISKVEGAKEPIPKKQRAANTRAQQYNYDDAVSRAFHKLLRCASIGGA
ncbi:hypothetical protein C9J12_18195 [Photobacterium frigidiphilum]|uniref:Uncharacterized protein n=1 Tax=Photobacterium frigidiphilum TaxID=264736 RepID=A0A2T3JCM2_9GAMM|nr:hypothetical protein [Photobacterium frigidiphilum]PSU46641.1 hypothetical protein C9J12_18195 [Photobacterium frigidiphilum]